MGEETPFTLFFNVRLITGSDIQIVKFHQQDDFAFNTNHNFTDYLYAKIALITYDVTRSVSPEFESLIRDKLIRQNLPYQIPINNDAK